ncbi:uncharacterized protein METZ01_LOCUS342578 [marine metagenome]|uniref:Uncharacterized protein n=1 Tax=marine metagenome TaxID=408172 RepID=A0A382QW47_9ZZZZ
MTREELKSYIFEIQDTIKFHLNKGGNVDSFLDETDLIDDFESVLPDEDFGIFVITVLNGIKTESIINTLLDSILSTIQSKSLVINS